MQLGMGRIKVTSLAYQRNILPTNPAATRENVNGCDSITNWRLALVCVSNSARLPTASEALAGAGEIGGRG